MATVTVTLDSPSAQPTAQSSPNRTLVTVVALPFELHPTFRVSKADDVEVSLLYNADGYALLILMAPNTAQPTTLRIDNAFNLIDERAQGRVKFECDPSFQYLQSNRDVLNLPMTISEFDIAITLPRDYRNDELSFEPSKDNWVERRAGREYTLPLIATRGKGQPVFIAFPSPFERGLHFAQLIIGILIGLFLLGVEGHLGIGRKLGRKSLSTVLVLSLIANAAALYFGFTVANPLEFAAWALGPLVPLVAAPFVCTWLLVAMYFEAEISGQVQSGGENARYIDVSILASRDGEKVVLKRTTVTLDGGYRFFVWCGRSSKSVSVVAKAPGTTRMESSEFTIRCGMKTHVPVLDVQRIDVGPAVAAPVPSKNE